jgi:hypothetical protein
MARPSIHPSGPMNDAERQSRHRGRKPLLAKVKALSPHHPNGQLMTDFEIIEDHLQVGAGELTFALEALEREGRPTARHRKKILKQAERAIRVAQKIRVMVQE